MVIWSFVFVVLTWLGWGDPLAQHDVAALYLAERIVNAITYDGTHCLWSEADGRVHWDTTCAQSNQWNYHFDQDGRWWACALAHEAEHVLYKGNERQARLRQYVCLDRLGAPQWQKDQMYGLVAEEAATHE